MATLRPTRTAPITKIAATRYCRNAGARRRRPVVEALQATNSRTTARIRNRVALTITPTPIIRVAPQVDEERRDLAGVRLCPRAAQPRADTREDLKKLGSLVDLWAHEAGTR